MHTAVQYFCCRLGNRLHMLKRLPCLFLSGSLGQGGPRGSDHYRAGFGRLPDDRAERYGRGVRLGLLQGQGAVPRVSGRSVRVRVFDVLCAFLSWHFIGLSRLFDRARDFEVKNFPSSGPCVIKTIVRWVQQHSLCSCVVIGSLF